MTIDNPAEEDTRDVEEVVAPVEEPVAKSEKAASKKRTPAQKAARKRKAAAARKQQSEKADAPINVPTTPGEIRDAAVELKDRAKAIGAKPLIEGVGEIAGRFFGYINDLFDDVEKKK